MSEDTKPEPSPFEKPRDVTRRSLAVPKKEIELRQAEWQKARAQEKIIRPTT
jgi:hypothetical protein